jgi:hypothetical protein
MNPSQSFWPRWAYGLSNGNHNHYRRRCVHRHTHSIIYCMLGKHIEHEPPARHVHIMAGLSRCSDAMPIASVPTRNGLIFTTPTLGALLASICQSTSRRISKYYFLIKLWIAPRRCTHPPGDGTRQSILTQSITKNRPFYNPSRGRSIRQGGRLGGNYKEIKTCH